jgi:hypothetical protein
MRFTVNVPVGTVKVCLLFTEPTLPILELALIDSLSAIRTSNMSTMTRIMRLDPQEKVTEAFYSSGKATQCPPDKSAHISSHNAVTFHESTARERVQAQSKARYNEKLEKNYLKAQKRAEKKGRKLPDRDDYYAHWGYSYYSKCLDDCEMENLQS